MSLSILCDPSSAPRCSCHRGWCTSRLRRTVTATTVGCSGTTRGPWGRLTVADYFTPFNQAYLVDRDHMGGFNPTDNSQIVQTIPVSWFQILCTPALWQNSIYFLATDDVLRAFQLSGGLLSPAPTSQASTAFSYPGASPVISANGTTNGIVWALDNNHGGPAVLHAYDATDVSVELYNRTQAGSRDQAGPAVKFSVPTVANG